MRLGEGGMGTVYEVEHTTLGRTCALKVLRANVIARDPIAAQRFVREARAAARIRHPNIVDVFDFGYLADGRPYFVMELLSGQSLADLVDLGPIDPARTIQIARHLALALAAAHDHGVIHADVTPSNALVDTANGLHVKLVDFGLAELLSERVTDGVATVVLGTPAYISPEQIRGLPPTEKSDQYGLGAVIFEMLAGHPPFEDADLRQVCLLHLEAPVPEPVSPHGPLPPGLIDIVTTCLQKAPTARFPNMRALLTELDHVESVAGRQGWRRWLAR
jgi:serine/threonine-protein kinase